MSELDGKLDYILKSNAAVQVNFDEYSRKDFARLIPKIKQAFADAGYTDTMKRYIDAGGDPEYVIVSKVYMQGLMTGREWFERFERELGYFDNASSIDGPSFVPSPSALKASILKSSRRAAGLGDEKPPLR